MPVLPHASPRAGRRYPCDVTHAICRTCKTFPRRGRSPPSNLGHPERCSQVRRKRTPRISQRRAARTWRAARRLLETALRAISGPGPWALAGRALSPGTPLVSGLVLLNDRRRDAAALAYLVAALPGPRPDLRTPLATRAGTCPAAPAAGPSAPRMTGVCAELVMQFLGVSSAHVDLVRSSLKGERNCLLTHDLTIVGKVADDRRRNLPCHEIQPFRCSQHFRFAKHIPEPLRLTIHAPAIRALSCAYYENDGIPEGDSNSA